MVPAYLHKEGEMVEKANEDRRLVAAIVAGGISIIPGFAGMLFFILGIAFKLDPYGGRITVNGVTLHGEEAAAAAIRLGNIFIVVGGILLVITAVIDVICVVNAVKAVRNR